jgi:hypothetical protein
MSQRVEFKVSFLLPPLATVAHAKNYVVDAVSTMCGCYRPMENDGQGEPMSELDRNSVQVTRIQKRRAK